MKLTKNQLFIGCCFTLGFIFAVAIITILAMKIENDQEQHRFVLGATTFICISVLTSLVVIVHWGSQYMDADNNDHWDKNEEFETDTISPEATIV